MLGLRRLVSTEHRASLRVAPSMVNRVQTGRENWLWEQLILSDSTTDCRKPWDSASTTVMLLLTCGASLASCFQLVSSISPDSTINWISPEHVGYLVAPFATSLAGLSAMCLHRRGHSTTLDSGQLVGGAIISTSRLLCLIPPASMLAEWTASLGHSSVFYSPFQIAVLSITILLPVSFLRTGGDDWSVL